ncbi:MAG: plasmid pRiA4b ORF-3 family protein [Micromonosporaceae bacterium]
MAAPSAAVISPELAEAALSCAALTRARRLAAWVSPGRTLTTSGVLRPAEAAQACRDLGIEVPGPRLRSALDVEELMQDWVTAAAAGFLEIDGRRAWAAPDLPEAGSSTPPEPGAILSAWVRAATALLDLGEEPCAGCLTVLHELHAAAGPLTMEQLASAVGAVLEPDEPEGAPCPGCGQAHDPGDLPGLDDFLGDEDEDGDDTAGHAAGTVTGLLAFGAADADDGAVRLTPLGAMLAESVFQRRAPSPDADAATVISAISELPPPVARTVARPWLSARSAAGAARELFAFAESKGDGQRVAALAFAKELGPDAADAWREWAKRPGIGAYARQWLRLQGEQVAEDPADEAWLAVDALSVMLDTLADTMPPFLLQAILAQQAGEEVAEAAELMLRSGHPRAPDIVARLTGRPALAATRGPASARRSQFGRSGRSGITGQSTGGRGRRSESGTLVYQLKITLRGVSKPPVWRRVLVPADVTLRDLHEVIQQAMGWNDYHMHVFSTGRQEYGSPDPELGHASDGKVLLSQVLTGPGDRLRYTYDFGDDWEHDIVLEETRTAVPGETYRSCVAGKGACPPEDCGGAWGYAGLKEVLADPSHEDHQDMLEWLGLDAGEDFDPKEFSVAGVNARLRPLTKAR